MKRIVLSILFLRCALLWLSNLNSVQLKSIPNNGALRTKRDAELYQLLSNTFGVSDDFKNAAISIPCSVESYEDYAPLFTDICESENCCEDLERLVPKNKIITQELTQPRTDDSSKVIMDRNTTEWPFTQTGEAISKNITQIPKNETNFAEFPILTAAKKLSDENSNTVTTETPQNKTSNITDPIFITMSKPEHPCHIYFLNQTNNTNKAKSKTSEKRNKIAKVPDPPKILIDGLTEENKLNVTTTTEPNLQFTENINKSTTANIIEKNVSTTTENALNSTTIKNTLTQTTSTTSTPLNNRKRNSTTKIMSAAASTKIEDSDVLDTNLCGNFCQLNDAVYPEGNPKRIIKSYLEPIAFETDLRDPYKKQQQQNSQDYFIDDSKVFHVPEAKFDVHTPPSFHINNILRGFSRNWPKPLFGNGGKNLNCLQRNRNCESNENLKQNCIKPNICQSNEDILSFKTNNDIQHYRPRNFRGYFT